MKKNELKVGSLYVARIKSTWNRWENGEWVRHHFRVVQIKAMDTDSPSKIEVLTCLEPCRHSSSWYQKHSGRVNPFMFPNPLAKGINPWPKDPKDIQFAPSGLKHRNFIHLSRFEYELVDYEAFRSEVQTWVDGYLKEKTEDNDALEMTDNIHKLQRCGVSDISKKEWTYPVYLTLETLRNIHQTLIYPKSQRMIITFDGEEVEEDDENIPVNILTSFFNDEESEDDLWKVSKVKV